MTVSRHHTRTLHLNVNVTGSGRHPGAWQLQDDPNLFVDVDFYTNIARIAERGTFDAVFLADLSAVPAEPPVDTYQALDNSVLLGALAVATERIGLVGTASTTFNDPFGLARRYATLDHVSRGRAAVNLVTTYSPTAALNFGLSALPDHRMRYRRAEEFVDVLGKLWDSWEDGAIVGDRLSKVFADGSKIHTIDHVGEFFSVRGPAVSPRSPQGRPLIVQAGSSEPGRAFGARAADAIFTTQTTLHGAQEFYRDIKSRASAHGRDPEQLFVLPGFFPVVGSTEAEATARKARLNELFDFDREIPRLAATLGLDPAELKLDREIPYEKVSSTENFAGSHGMLAATADLAFSERFTVRQLIQHSAGFHRQVVGTPEQVADHMEEWFLTRGADGFNLNFDVFPASLEIFVDHVVPELRRRGLFRSEYSGTTLREHFGIPVPPSRYALTVVPT
ncbi:LLM class flavin-dependent oxidoreductase [Rhodococcoides yunnanense]|uniref:LLM class flavin-dependent oxidoreductase n=1 Tax=Rhodococcoides yunnanense TaxID=278209 RepID=UPI0009324918|nr:LLM class flavin-dependent oxidoreductase [Rhodococcus yunnanensis]